MALLPKDIKNLWLKLGTEYSMSESDSQSILYRFIGIYELRISNIDRAHNYLGMSVIVRSIDTDDVTEIINGIKTCKSLKLLLSDLIPKYSKLSRDVSKRKV